MGAKKKAKSKGKAKSSQKWREGRAEEAGTSQPQVSRISCYNLLQLHT